VVDLNASLSVARGSSAAEVSIQPISQAQWADCTHAKSPCPRAWPPGTSPSRRWNVLSTNPEPSRFPEVVPPEALGDVGEVVPQEGGGRQQLRPAAEEVGEQAKATMSAEGRCLVLSTPAGRAWWEGTRA